VETQRVVDDRLCTENLGQSMSELPHFDSEGHSRMVDVGDKPTTRRVAVASGKVEMNPATLTFIRDCKIQKGDVLELARIAGVMATKRTSDLIPLCHPLRLDSVDVAFEYLSETVIGVKATVAATERTGVEMESLNAVAVAGLVIYDMCKSVDRGMRITDIQLEEKSGGKSGHFQRNIPRDET
jgi:cyclic pyranopterin phosphate synthase